MSRINADRIAEITIRRATSEDLARIIGFQAAALRILAKRDYERTTLDQFIREIGTMPADIVSCGQLYVLEYRGDIVATGGWRWRQGDVISGDDRAYVSDSALNGTYAEISALYVDPFFARIGLATWLLGTLEREIARMGLREVRIAATITGLPLCQKNGYRPFRLITVRLGDGTTFQTVAVAKPIAVMHRGSNGDATRAMLPAV